MKILVTFAGRPYKLAGVPNIWLFFDENTMTVKEVLSQLKTHRNLDINVKDVNIVILVNGRNIEYIGGLNTKLNDLDKILIASIVGGG